MFAKYSCEINGFRIWEDSTKAVYDKAKDAAYYKKIVFFYPDDNVYPIWLWTAGHECATPQKNIYNRMWHSRWVLHICVRGKGYYNGQLIEPGMAFICWPGLIHSLKAKSDSQEPFEFYWFMLRGEKMLPTVREHGFRSENLIFKCNYADDIVPIMDVIINSDYNKVNVKLFNESMVKILLSYNLFGRVESANEAPVQQDSSNYVTVAKNLLYDYSYALTVEELSKKMGLSAKHFNIIFQKVQGESPKKYIVRKRLLHGVDLLKGGMIPTEVAHMIGYSDYSAFYRAFKKEFKVAPSAYSSKKQ